jgi:hypothetical protein
MQGVLGLEAYFPAAHVLQGSTPLKPAEPTEHQGKQASVRTFPGPVVLCCAWQLWQLDAALEVAYLPYSHSLQKDMPPLLA